MANLNGLEAEVLGFVEVQGIETVKVKYGENLLKIILVDHENVRLVK